MQAEKPWAQLAAASLLVAQAPAAEAPCRCWGRSQAQAERGHALRQQRQQPRISSLAAAELLLPLRLQRRRAELVWSVRLAEVVEGPT